MEILKLRLFVWNQKFYFILLPTTTEWPNNKSNKILRIYCNISVFTLKFLENFLKFCWKIQVFQSRKSESELLPFYLTKKTVDEKQGWSHKKRLIPFELLKVTFAYFCEIWLLKSENPHLKSGKDEGETCEKWWESLVPRVLLQIQKF